MYASSGTKGVFKWSNGYNSSAATHTRTCRHCGFSSSGISHQFELETAKYAPDFVETRRSRDNELQRGFE